MIDHLVDMQQVLINGKWYITIPKHRADRAEWYTKKGWERARLDSMHEHIKKGDYIFYVGAEEGEMAALCQMWGAEVFLIEPNPKVWPNIRAIWQANKLKDPKGSFAGFASDMNRIALTPVTKNSEYDNTRTWPECAYDEVIGNHGFKELDKEADSFHQMTIDEIVRVSALSGEVTPPTGISIDVEGAEWRVLRGATNTLKQFKPKLWVSGHPEFMLTGYGTYLRDMREWLKSEFGYEETLLDYDHEAHLLYI